jgi:hypothetical protein
MFELIVLGVVLVGLTAIARWPLPKHRTETQTPPAPGAWAPQTDWRQFHRPTYLRRGIAPGQCLGRVHSPPANPSPAGEPARSETTGEAS